MYKPGDVFITRNSGGKEANPTPGYYNHAAILGINDWVVEAQESFDQIIAVPLKYFLKRYPEIVTLRPNDNDVALKTAEYSLNMIGRKYDKVESIRPLWLWRTDDNCISLVRRIYYKITGRDYMWLAPDQLYLSPSFKIINIYKSGNFVAPDDLYQGAILTKPGEKNG